VSRVIATTRKTKRPSTRTLAMTVVGFASSKKTRDIPDTNTRASDVAGVCIRALRRMRAAADPAAFAIIRSNAPGASAAACGSDSRGVTLQLGLQNGCIDP